MEVKTAELAAIRALGKPAENENLEFHFKIAEIANNPVIFQLLKLVMMEHAAYVHFSFMDYTLVGSNLFHGQIFEAIKNHDPEQASSLMYEHLNALVTTMQNMEYNQFLGVINDQTQKDES